MMTRSQVTLVLAKAAAFDQRTIGEADAEAWMDVIGDLPFDAAKAAVSTHYRAETRRIMPADIRRIVLGDDPGDVFDRLEGPR